MADEQELKDIIEQTFAEVAGLSIKEHKNVLGDKWKYINAVIAKLKALGWKSPAEVTGLILDEHNQHADDVKWDREKVFEALYYHKFPNAVRYKIKPILHAPDLEKLADQLKEILTGE